MRTSLKRPMRKVTRLDFPHNINLVKKIISALRQPTRISSALAARARTRLNSIINRYRLLTLRLRILHVHGRTNVTYSNEELVVICVVRNGAIYINSFIKYYFAFGVKHIVFLDNGSSDDTIKVASSYNNVTVLKTSLPYSKYENQMKEYLARRFSKGRWNLCADIDEFFDWPFSRIIGLQSLLRYLNAGRYTAVVAQMLDLFSDLPLSRLKDDLDEDIAQNYKYYDTSCISKADYQYSRLSNDKVKMHWGGIRKTVFGTNNGLTKAPLVFVAGRVQLFRDWHHAKNAFLADFTCALLHYPFTSTFYEKVREAAATKRYGYITSDEYDMYWRRLSREPELTLRLETSRRYAGIEFLLDEGFLVASPEYLDWVRGHSKSPVDQGL
jgi:hypothetical protein